MMNSTNTILTSILTPTTPTITAGQSPPLRKRARSLPRVALTALAATFKTVDTTSIGGRPIRPLMQFKSREGGIWVFGQRRTIPEPNSLWAVNPASFQWGWVCWGDGNKILGERLVSISEPLPDVTELPDKGFPWQQEMAVNLKCVSGTDAGTEVVFKTNTEGGKGEVVRLIEAVRDRLSGAARRQSLADRATRKLLLPASAVRQDLGPADDRRGLDVVGRPGTGT